MPFDKEEREIRQLMEKYELKKPPEDLMKNYVGEVKRKLQSPPGPVFGTPAVALLILVAFVGGLLVAGLLRQGFVPQKVVRQAVSEERVSHPSEAGTEQLFEDLFDDFFVLEMLGEEEGLIEGIDAVESDVEFLMGA